MALSRTQVNIFNEKGYLIVPDVFGNDELSKMKVRIKEYLDGCREYDERWLTMEPGASDVSGESPRQADRIRKLCMITLVDPLFHKMATHSKFIEVLQGCLGNNVCAWASNIFLKQATHGERQPWHRDTNHYQPPSATIWTPLMDSTVKNGCMWAAPATHLINVGDGLTSEYNLEQERKFHAGEFEHEIVPLEMKAGDSLIWDTRMLHSSESNSSEASRWAFTLHCSTTEAVIERKKIRPDAGPHELIAGRLDDQTARQVFCMHRQPHAFADFVLPEDTYK